MKNIKVVFMGTPDFAVPVLDMLIKNTNVVLVVTQPDACVGRKKELKASPVKELAIANNIPVFQPVKIREDYSDIAKYNPDLIITCAYGQIIPQGLLDMPRLGCVNVHASLLPKYRGGAPIHHALINGDEKTGVTIMYMDASMDTGDIIKQEEVVIEDTDNVGTLHDKLSKVGAKLLLEVLPSIIDATALRVKQSNKDASYAPVIKRDMERLNFNDTCLNIHNKVRGLNPWPLANALINNQEFKIIEGYIGEDTTQEPGVIVNITKDALGISTLDKVYYVTRLKPFGKKEMFSKDYLNGVNKSNLLNTKVG